MTEMVPGVRRLEPMHFARRRTRLLLPLLSSRLPGLLCSERSIRSLVLAVAATLSLPRAHSRQNAPLAAAPESSPAAPRRAHPEREFALQANSPDFWRLLDRGAKLSVLASGFGFTEGPVWDAQGFLYVSDETQNRIYRIDLSGEKKAVFETSDPDGNTYDKNHRLIDCASVLRAIVRVNPEDGTYQTLVDRFKGKRLNSPNDVVVGPDGALYFTDPTLDLPKGEAQELPFQGVYRLDGNGNLDLLVQDLEQPNGLAFSPDGKHLYVDDTKTREIHVYNFDHGKVSSGRLFGSEPGTGGVPDGIRVDEAGNLFVTGPGGIWVWSPEGEHLGTIVLPRSAANLSWGGADYKTLFITAGPYVYGLNTVTRGFVPYR